MAHNYGIPYAMNAKDFSMLRNFCSSYFHEDWGLEADDPDQVMSSYLEEGWDSAELRELAGQILQFAKSYTTDAALEEALLSELGCYYKPSADNISSREWLEQIALRLLEAAEGVDSL